ncbi:MAG: triphosphoribosyl-dephospho-CoA synthase, partial [Lachnospiraceae bacterium]|nr:triphosphoribosyl-dephospho-CoA synthase [Lachnospiraceae bacterium]
AAGFPSVRKALEPLVSGTVFPKDFLENDSLVRVLLGFIAEGNDTNLIARGGLEKARRAAEQARALLAFEPIESAAILELDRAFIAENLSPGGSADLLAVTIFLGETASLNC